MPTQTFSSFEAYADAIQSVGLRTICLGPKRTNFALSYLTMNNLTVQWGQDGCPNMSEGTVSPGGIGIVMPSQNVQSISVNGRSCDDRSLMVLTPGDEFCIVATNWNRWFSVFIPDEMRGELNGTPAAIESSSSFLQVPLSRAERFRSAMDHLSLIVRKEPAAFDSPAVLNTTARKLAQTVREALGGDLDVTQPQDRREIPKKQIIRKAMDFVDQRAGEYVPVRELATAAGVSERTLRTAFREYFRIGPVRFLKLRTLHQARRALIDSDCSTTTVADIATRFGVWEFGRFAHDYRLLFGELPSETLRHLR
jgi:AraC family transcriptional regulator, ethanolamine operon transcriptional activator